MGLIDNYISTCPDGTSRRDFETYKCNKFRLKTSNKTCYWTYHTYVHYCHFFVLEISQKSRRNMSGATQQYY